AENLEDGSRYALKVLKPEHAMNPLVVERFFNEARALWQIGHPHLVEVCDHGTTEDGFCYFVMELLRGETLMARLTRHGPLPLRRALHIGIQIAEALEATHRQDIVHRDLKPGNVFLIDRDGDHDYVKLLDYGIAKLAEPEGGKHHYTKTGVPLGTP